MKIFLSSLENGVERATLEKWVTVDGVPLNYNLMSYYYLRTKEPLAEYIRDNSKEVLIDSGAHSFQKGKRVDWQEYTRKYAEFIKRFDRPHVIGFFEMDVDNIIGYDRVLQLRKVLESVSSKIIPVWHSNRGIDDYKRMCQRYSGKVVAISGFKNSDIKDEQYLMFVKYARRYNCRVHCLGMTRKDVLNKVPFDYVDSSTWKQHSLYGVVASEKRRVSRAYSRTNRADVLKMNYLHGVELQKHYYAKWYNECWRDKRG